MISVTCWISETWLGLRPHGGTAPSLGRIVSTSSAVSLVRIVLGALGGIARSRRAAGSMRCSKQIATALRTRIVTVIVG